MRTTLTFHRIIRPLRAARVKSALLVSSEPTSACKDLRIGLVLFQELVVERQLRHNVNHGR